jgi:hypothetical protein
MSSHPIAPPEVRPAGSRRTRGLVRESKTTTGLFSKIRLTGTLPSKSVYLQKRESLGESVKVSAIAKSFTMSGERGGNRTYNLLIKSQLLCQLSYAPDFLEPTSPFYTCALPRHNYFGPELHR